MVGVPQGAMHVALQIWQVVLASQTFQVFCFGPSQKGTICSSVYSNFIDENATTAYFLFI